MATKSKSAARKKPGTKPVVSKELQALLDIANKAIDAIANATGQDKKFRVKMVE